jgi:glycosyltransferase involved in cell wall biosynthesis
VTTAAAPVLFCGAWDEGPGYPRTTALRRGLEQLGIAVHDCRVDGLGRSKQRLVQQPWRWPAAMLRHLRAGRELTRTVSATSAARQPRCVVVPYPGHFVVRRIRAATRAPVVLDLFLSAYDSAIEDRRLAEPGSLLARWLQRVDTRACAAADLVLLDTAENAAYVAALTGLPAERFAWLPLADPDADASGAATPWPAGPGPLRLLFFGTGVPLHGLPTLVAACARVPEVQLTLVGGTAADRASAVQSLGARVVLEPEFVPRTRLQDLLARSQLVAGVFGRSGKAQRVVPWKLVHALAAGRPVLTADAPAVLHWLDGSGAVFGVPADDIAALAAELQRLAAAPEQLAAAAAAARPAYDRHFSLQRCSERWRDLLDRLPAVGAA